MRNRGYVLDAGEGRMGIAGSFLWKSMQKPGHPEEQGCCDFLGSLPGPYELFRKHFGYSNEAKARMILEQAIGLAARMRHLKIAGRPDELK